MMSRRDSFVEFSSFYEVKTIGKEELESTVNNGRQKIILKDIWFVPGVIRNLFSNLAAQNRNRNSEYKSATTERWVEVNEKSIMNRVRQ